MVPSGENRRGQRHGNRRPLRLAALPARQAGQTGERPRAGHPVFDRKRHINHKMTIPLSIFAQRDFLFSLKLDLVWARMMASGTGKEVMTMDATCVFKRIEKKYLLSLYYYSISKSKSLYFNSSNSFNILFSSIDNLLNFSNS